MEKDVHELEQIIDYLENRLSDETRTEFEHSLAANITLAKELVQIADVLRGIELFGEEDLKKKFLLIENKLENQGHLLLENDIDEYIINNKKTSKAELIERRIANDADFVDIPVILTPIPVILTPLREMALSFKNLTKLHFFS